jgi:hypothetical protein
MKRKGTREGTPLSQSEFISLIKEAEKGPFKPIGTFDKFRKDVLKKSKYGKQKNNLSRTSL